MFAKVEDAQKFELEIKRFPRSYQRRLRRLVFGSSRLGDLLISFPAVAFALVSEFSNAERRGRTVGLVKAGASLRDVANELGLPMWTRKLPPEGFREPFGVLPCDEVFTRKVTQLVPVTSSACAVWLRWVLKGYRACDTRFALWLASQRSYSTMSDDSCVPVAPLAAYAWFSARPSKELGRALIRRPWQPSMGFAKAVDETQAWVSRMGDELRPVPQRRGPGRYSRRNALKGYYLVVLRTGAQLREEGRVMDHCVGSYDRKVATGGCVIVSIRRGPQRLATMELVRPRCDARAPYTIVQLQGPSNTRPTSSVRRVAQAWLSKYGYAPLSDGAVVDETTVDAKGWENLWSPYLARNREVVGSDGDICLPKLMCDVEQLANFV